MLGFFLKTIIYSSIKSNIFRNYKLLLPRCRANMSKLCTWHHSILLYCCILRRICYNCNATVAMHGRSTSVIPAAKRGYGTAVVPMQHGQDVVGSNPASNSTEFFILSILPSLNASFLPALATFVSTHLTGMQPCP